MRLQMCILVGEEKYQKDEKKRRVESNHQNFDLNFEDERKLMITRRQSRQVQIQIQTVERAEQVEIRKLEWKVSMVKYLIIISCSFLYGQANEPQENLVRCEWGAEIPTFVILANYMMVVPARHPRACRALV